MNEDEIIVQYLIGMMLWHSKLLFPFDYWIQHEDLVWQGFYDAAQESDGWRATYAPECLK